MTDEELTANALSDPDNPPLTEEDIRLMRPVLNVAAIRKRLRMTQTAFSDRFGIPVSTLRDWEHGRRFPDPAVRAYLTVIAHDPDGVMRALGTASKAHMLEGANP